MMIAMFSACGGGGTDDNPEPEFGSGTVTHNGTTYGTVTSPYTGRVWLDRNLGAAQTCTAYNDTACYGDYYQWGRNFDGHQDSTSATTTVLAVDINNAGSEFITDNADWAPGSDTSGALRSANWSKTDGSSICPVGFRVPTMVELKNETVDASIAVTNNIDAFSNFLKLPSAGERRMSGAMGSQDMSGSVWSSFVEASASQSLVFSFTGVVTMPDLRIYGYSVRCIQN
jgi:uncharacterized protein (TIGR02145 family)